MINCLVKKRKGNALPRPRHILVVLYSISCEVVRMAGKVYSSPELCDQLINCMVMQLAVFDPLSWEDNRCRVEQLLSAKGTIFPIGMSVAFSWCGCFHDRWSRRSITGRSSDLMWWMSGGIQCRCRVDNH